MSTILSSVALQLSDFVVTFSTTRRGKGYTHITFGISSPGDVVLSGLKGTASKLESKSLVKTFDEWLDSDADCETYFPGMDTNFSVGLQHGAIIELRLEFDKWDTRVNVILVGKADLENIREFRDFWAHEHSLNTEKPT